MKKQFKLFSILIALMVIIGSISFNEVAIAIENECYNVGNFNIYAGKTKLIGSVDVTLYQNKILFIFDLDDGVTASEYHINILSVPPTEKGRPGHYTHKGTPSPANDFEVEVSHDFQPGETIYLMTHLSVEGTNDLGEDVDGDTAFAGEIVDGSPWYGYFSMKVPVCEESWEGTIRVIKTIIDPDAPTPEGISFTLTGPNGYNETKETNVEGIIQFTELQKGEYFLTEDIPEGYSSSIENGKTINLSKDATEDDIAEINVINTKIPDDTDPKGSLTIKKIVKDHRDEIIEDGTEFKFEIYNLNDTLLDTITIVGNSSVTLDLDLGNYMIKEVSIPKGYSLISDNEINFEILEDKETAVTFTNKKDAPSWTGTLVIQKIIESYYPALLAESTRDLSGFIFELWKDGVRVTDPSTTEEDGTVTFGGLLAGEYEIRETNSQGYIPRGPFNFTLSPESTDNEIYYHEFYNEPIPVEDIVVQKIVIDEEKENPDLKGFTFHLYRLVEGENGSTEEFVKEVTTEEDGFAIFSDLEFGIYMLYEDPVEGYEMGLGAYGSRKGLQIIHSEEYTEIIEVTNTKIPKWNGTIEVIKTVADERNTSPNLAGFIFRLYKMVEGGEEFVEEQTTGSTGVLYFSGLEEAIYKLYELDRAGYLKGIANTGSIITLNGETVGEGNIITTGVTNIVIYSNEPEPEPEPETTPDPEEEPDDEDDEIEEDIPESIPEIIIAEDPEEEIILEEIPQAAPEEQILSVESVPEEEEELVVIEEAVPLAAPILPKTGSASAYVTYGIGSLLLAIGAFLKKKKD